MIESEKGLERILMEIEEDLDGVMNPKGFSEAWKMHRELSVLSSDELLIPFTI